MRAISLLLFLVGLLVPASGNAFCIPLTFTQVLVDVPPNPGRPVTLKTTKFPPQFYTCDGQGNVSANVTNMTLTLIWKRDRTGEDALFRTQYEVYNGSHTYGGDQTLELLFYDQNWAFVASANSYIRREQCTYGGSAKVSYEFFLVPAKNVFPRIRNVTMKVHTVTGVQKPC